MYSYTAWLPPDEGWDMMGLLVTAINKHARWTPICLRLRRLFDLQRSQKQKTRCGPPVSALLHLKKRSPSGAVRPEMTCLICSTRELSMHPCSLRHRQPTPSRQSSTLSDLAQRLFVTSKGSRCIGPIWWFALPRSVPSPLCKMLRHAGMAASGLKTLLPTAHAAAKRARPVFSTCT